MKHSKIILVIFAFTTLVLLSEGLYQFRNNINLQAKTYLIFARFLANKSRVGPALIYLEKAANIRVSQLKKVYPNLEDITPEVPFIPNNEQLIESFKLILLSLDIQTLSQFKPEKLGKVFYTLGLAAYENKEPILVIPLFQKAISLAPEWSYFHVELANFYVMMGQDQEAKNTLEKCFNFKNPKEHCQQYINNNFESEIYEKVGFLKEAINEKI